MASPCNRKQQLWTQEEHERFLEAIRIYPRGAWKDMSKVVGTKNARQTQTHAQKYFEKMARHAKGLKKQRRSLSRQEHRLEVTSDRFAELLFQADASVSSDDDSVTSPTASLTYGDTFAFIQHSGLSLTPHTTPQDDQDRGNDEYLDYCIDYLFDVFSMEAALV